MITYLWVIIGGSRSVSTDFRTGVAPLRQSRIESRNGMDVRRPVGNFDLSGNITCVSKSASSSDVSSEFAIVQIGVS